MEADHPADRDNRQANALLGGLALLYFLLEWIPGFVGAYGYFIDEFYYVACSKHLAFGYVDHPSLSIVILWLSRLVIGDSLPALRFLPALAGAATVILTGLIARRLGAGTWGQGIAAGAVMIGTIYQITFGYYSMNAFDVLLWAVCFRLLIEIELREDPRLWLPLGALAGLALQNKHTFVLLLAGLGLVLTPARRHLAGRWLWIGSAAAALIVLPNLAWQAAHGWPSLEFYRNADFYKNVPTPPLQVLFQQILTMNPGALPVWLAGLAFLLFTERGRRLRHLGWVYVALLVLMVVAQKSRPDRIANAYTVLFAAGGVLLGDWGKRPRLDWLRWALPALLLLSGIALSPLGLPLLAPPAMARYSAALGVVPQIEKGEGKRTELPQWFADRLGWERLVDDVAAAAGRIAPEERGRSAILAPSYGQAGALELLGRGRGLPPVYGTQNSYHHWGPPRDPPASVLIIGPFTEAMAGELFEEVELAGIHDCDWCMRWRDEAKIWLARGPKAPLRDVWGDLKHYE